MKKLRFWAIIAEALIHDNYQILSEEKITIQWQPKAKNTILSH